MYKVLRSIMDRRKLCIVYKAITEPIVPYGIIGWERAYENILKSLQIYQHSLFRIALNMWITHHILSICLTTSMF